MTFSAKTGKITKMPALILFYLLSTHSLQNNACVCFFYVSSRYYSGHNLLNSRAQNGCVNQTGRDYIGIGQHFFKYLWDLDKCSRL